MEIVITSPEDVMQMLETIKFIQQLQAGAVFVIAFLMVVRAIRRD